MGDRHLFNCPECGEEIMVGGGFNESEDGIIECHDCKTKYRMEIRLVKIKGES